MSAADPRSTAAGSGSGIAGQPSSRGTVIVGVEGSERSADALALGDLLAARLEAGLLIVHTHSYGALSSLLDAGHYESLVREVYEETFRQVQAQIGEGREREMLVISADSPAAGLIRVAERDRALLIVVGSTQRSGLGRVRPGSVGDRLLSGASTPVAIAPRGYAEGGRPLTTIACGYDGSEESQLALEWAAGLAKAAECHLKVVSVYTPQVFGSLAGGGAISVESVNSMLARELADAQRDAIAVGTDEAEGILRRGDAAKVLEQVSRETDLLVMGSRGYGPFRAVLLGSVSQSVSRDAACPVVFCPRGAVPSGADEDNHASRP
ncbi:MAG: universal stress protein [Actinobacteria bacterium]|nr:universal stress protein [Actinomycetota bacterium]